VSEDQPGDARYGERRRRRGVARELSAEEFAAMVEDAAPRTEDDVPWRFPVKVRMRRAGRGG
jgi:hypothetical protein